MPIKERYNLTRKALIKSINEQDHNPSIKIRLKQTPSQLDDLYEWDLDGRRQLKKQNNKQFENNNESSNISSQ